MTGDDRDRPRPKPPTLAEMRSRLRAGMPEEEFFATLDEIVVERGLSLSLPTADERLIALPVADGGELLCFLRRPFLFGRGRGALVYVEYQGDVFLELESPPSGSWLTRWFSGRRKQG